MPVLTNRDVKPSGRVLRLCPAFCLREARWWLQLEVRKTSNLHYTTALHTISHTTYICIYIYKKNIYVVDRHFNEWMNDDILTLKAIRRKNELIWRKTRTTINFGIYYDSCKAVKRK